MGGTGFQPVVFGILPKTGEGHPHAQHIRLKEIFFTLEIRQDAGFNRLKACSTKESFLRHFDHIAVLQPEIVFRLRLVGNVHGEHFRLGGRTGLARDFHPR